MDMTVKGSAYVLADGAHRLLRLAGIKRRSQGDPFRFIDKVSDLRQEFSFSARRIIVAAVYILIVVHWFACILWWTIRLQNYPAGKSACSVSPDQYMR